MRLLMHYERVLTAKRAFTQYRDVERCAAETSNGQCKNTLNGGEGGGHVDFNGERIPLCTTHLRKARAEGYS